MEEQETYARVGVPFHLAYWPAQLTWLRATRPDIFQKAARWCSFGDYFLQQLFGEYVCSYSVASWTGLLNRFTLCWDTPLLDALRLGDGQLSRLVPSTFYFSGLAASFAARWPLLKDARWFPAMGDGAAANIGSGCFDATRAALTIGTTAALRVVLHETPQQIPHGLWCYRADERRALLGPSAPAEAMPVARAPDAHALTFLPLIAGERSPGWRADARGALTGLSLTTQPADLMRASLEAVAIRLGFV